MNEIEGFLQWINEFLDETGLSNYPSAETWRNSLLNKFNEVWGEGYQNGEDDMYNNMIAF